MSDPINVRIGRRIQFTRDEQRKMYELTRELERTLAHPKGSWQARAVLVWNAMGRVIRGALERSHDPRPIRDVMGVDKDVCILCGGEHPTKDHLYLEARGEL
jgi:L-serine deaminase